MQWVKPGTEMGMLDKSGFLLETSGLIFKWVWTIWLAIPVSKFWTLSMNLLIHFIDSSENKGFCVSDINKWYLCRREKACYMQVKWKYTSCRCYRYAWCSPFSSCSLVQTNKQKNWKLSREHISSYNKHQEFTY